MKISLISRLTIQAFDTFSFDEWTIKQMRLLPIISFLWAGVLLGTSFLATPAKFLAPSLSLPEALEVGRVTFMVLSWVEYGFLIVFSLSLLLYLRSSRLKTVQIGAVFILISMIALQQIWILPELNYRTTLVIQGAVLERSNLHFMYIGTELLKIITLITFAIVSYTFLQYKSYKNEFYYE